MAVGLGYKDRVSVALETTYGTAITNGSSTDHVRCRFGSGPQYDPGIVALEGVQGTMPGMQQSVHTLKSVTESLSFDLMYQGYEVPFRSWPASYSFTAESAGAGTANTHIWDFGAADTMFDGTADEPQTFTMWRRDSTLSNKTQKLTSCFVTNTSWEISPRIATLSLDVFSGYALTGETADETWAPASGAPVVQKHHLAVANLAEGATAIVRRFSLNANSGWDTSDDRYGSSGQLLSPVIGEMLDPTGEMVLEFQTGASDYANYIAGVAATAQAYVQDNVTITLDSGLDVDTASSITDNYKYTWTLDQVEWQPGVRRSPEGPGPVLLYLPFKLLPDNTNTRFFRFKAENDRATAI
ncbi:MAG: hypothetical protein VW405_02895 [Rhodospirillaceae bacterium]